MLKQISCHLESALYSSYGLLRPIELLSLNSMFYIFMEMALFSISISSHPFSSSFTSYSHFQSSSLVSIISTHLFQLSFICSLSVVSVGLLSFQSIYFLFLSYLTGSEKTSALELNSPLQFWQLIFSYYFPIFIMVLNLMIESEFWIYMSLFSLGS